jgi:hypothetical protein
MPDTSHVCLRINVSTAGQLDTHLGLTVFFDKKGLPHFVITKQTSKYTDPNHIPMQGKSSNRKLKKATDHYPRQYFLLGAEHLHHHQVLGPRPAGTMLVLVVLHFLLPDVVHIPLAF